MIFRGADELKRVRTLSCADAAHAECTLLVAQTEVGTVSQHNMERADMRIAYIRAIWTTLEV